MTSAITKLDRAAFGARLVASAVIAVAVCTSRPASSDAEEPRRSLVLHGCAVFDPHQEKMIENQSIVIQGDRIVSVGPRDDSLSNLPETETIDARGQFAIPGLIDAHVHVVHVLNLAHVTGDEVLPLYLAAGVTSVRSTGDEIVAATMVARHAAAHPATSPRIFTCSPLLDGDPVIHRETGRAVTDPRQVPELLDDLLRWQVTTLKIYAGAGPEVGKAIVDEGHRRDLFVTAHLGEYSAQQAVADGIDGLEHIWSVFNYVIPADVAKQPGHRSRVDFNTPLCTALVSELARRQVLVDPTLAVFRNMILLPDRPDVRDHPDNALAPQRLRDFWPVYLRKSNCPGNTPMEMRAAEFAKYQELTGILYRAGVPLLAGTDAPEPQVTPGFSLHQELEMLVESGLPPAAALRAATLHNAMALRQTDHLGTIAPGKLADIVLLRENPLVDIRKTRTIDRVIRGGIVCRKVLGN